MDEVNDSNSPAPEEKENKKKPSSIAGTVILIIVGAVLVLNLAIVVMGFINPQRIPSFFGYKYLVVLTGSMAGEKPDCFDAGSLVIIKECDVSEYNVGDIITFQTGSDITTTHRIIEEKNGTFITKGDSNNIADTSPVTPDKIEGKVIYAIPNIGYIMQFIRSPIGMIALIAICCVVLFVPSLAKKNASEK